MVQVEPYRECCSITSILSPGATKIPLKLQEAIKEADTLRELTNDERLGVCQFVKEKIVEKGND